MRRVCAWCGEEQPPRDESGKAPVKGVSHTICRRCFDKQIAALKKIHGGER